MILDGIFTSPLPGCGFVSRTVGLVNMCDFRYEWVVGVGVGEHGADGEENCQTGQHFTKNSVGP
jgi:hypothetical protein